MVDKSIAREFDIDEQEINQQIEDALGSGDQEEILKLIDSTVQNFEPGTILKGTIVNHIGDDVIVEVGLKSEGCVSEQEFDDPSEIRIGDKIEVFLESVENDSGLVMISKRKADRIRGWERIIETYKEGDTIVGKVTRRIKGGLLVDVGVPVFLPASQVDIRRPNDITGFINKDIEAKILKIDQERRNIVISRRKLLEDTREQARNALLSEIEVGQIRTGTVKNIADFGAFIDLGGLDGLLHITDMSWGRVSHPSEIVKLDQKIEVKILSIDYEHEKVALGLKQKTENPWETAAERYKVNSIVRGEVVNIMNYGAFIKLEDGIEGLVHISEMSWTKRISNPADILTLGQEVDVAVLDVNPAKQEISLGIKQLTENPWTQVVNKYPPGTIIEGRIRNLANYGAFIEIEEGIDGLLHVSDMSWTKKINHPGEILKKGQTIKCIVLDVDQQKQRVALGLKQMTEDPWLHAIPEKYIPGQIVRGKVTKLTNFGAFVELEPDLEGLLHVSELSDEKVDGPQDIVKVGQELEIKILRVDIEDRKIGLSLKRAQWAAEDEQTDQPKQAVRGGLTGTPDMGTDMIDVSSIFNRKAKAAPVAAEVNVQTEASGSESATDTGAESEPTAETATVSPEETTTEQAAPEQTKEVAGEVNAEAEPTNEVEAEPEATDSTEADGSGQTKE